MEAELQAVSVGSLGLVGITSTHARFLQGKDNGELHASRETRSTEETWALYEVGEGIFALKNYEYNKFIAQYTDGCARSTQTAVSPACMFRIINGSEYGQPTKVAIRSVTSNNFLGANGPGQDTQCGGEVGCGDSRGPSRDPNWPGWWLMDSVTAPTVNIAAVTASLPAYIGQHPE